MSKFAYCLVSISPVRSEAKDQSEIVTQLLFGEVVSIDEIAEPWVKLTTYADAYQGFVDIKHLEFISEKETKRWLDGLGYLKSREVTLKTPDGNQRVCRGSFLLEGETSFAIGSNSYTIIDAPVSTDLNLLEVARDYLNTPYLWGGKSPFGIDCSGLVQVIYRLFDYNLPRDASDQIAHGSEISFDEHQAEDLAFFENKEGKIIHVGILTGKGTIIHASGHVREDLFTELGIIHSKTNFQTHQLAKIKRL